MWQSKKIQLVLELQKYGLDKNPLTCSLSRWAMDLLPEDKHVHKTLLLGAAMRGCTRMKEAYVGQVSFITDKAYICTLSIPHLRQRGRLLELAKELHLTKTASVLRTAILLGLFAPRIEKGVMSCTRTEPLTEMEIAELNTYSHT